MSQGHKQKLTTAGVNETNSNTPFDSELLVVKTTEEKNIHLLSTACSHSRSGESRKTGLGAVGDLPWGTHCCIFYETKADLLDILVPFLRAGLEEGELCVWVVSDPLTVEEAAAAFRRAVPDLDKHLTQRNLEILTNREWYLKEGSFDLSRVIARCLEKLGQAINTGRTGLRYTGDGSWVQAESRHDFHQYENELNRLISNQRLLTLCTYQLALSGPSEILDAARTHHFALALRKGQWDLLESPQLKAAKTEIIKLNEQLERRVIARTQELQTLNELLQREITERQQTEERLRRSEEQLHALAARLQAVREEESLRISREVHDVLGQALTTLDLDVLWLRQKLAREKNRELRSQFRDRIKSMEKLLKSTTKSVQRISSTLRPGILDELGLAATLEWQTEEFERRTRIHCHWKPKPRPVTLGLNEATALFRIFQEILTNVARHAEARSLQLQFRVTQGKLFLRVRDDGKGFTESDLPHRKSLGLLGMRERAVLVGADLEILSEKGKGTSVIVKLPLPNNIKRKRNLNKTKKHSARH